MKKKRKIYLVEAMIWEYFLKFLKNHIESSNQRRNDVKKKWNEVKQLSNQNVKKYASYLNDLKINLNFEEEVFKTKLLHDLNENFKAIVCFDDMSTTRNEVLTKALTHEKSFFVMKFNKFQSQKNQDQKEQNRKTI